MDNKIRRLERLAAAGDPESARRLRRERRRYDESLVIEIDGEIFVLDEDDHCSLGDGLQDVDVTLDGEKMRFILARDSEAAGEGARTYYAEMAQHDPREFVAIVGERVLIAWGLGQSAGPGSTSVSSLSEWLDIVASVPEEHYASYDGTERTVDYVSPRVVAILGFVPTVAYRS